MTITARSSMPTFRWLNVSCQHQWNNREIGDHAHAFDDTGKRQAKDADDVERGEGEQPTE